MDLTYQEVTTQVFEADPSYKEEGYVRFFLCRDVKDAWFVRILKDVNGEYEPEPGKFLIERNLIYGRNTPLYKIIQEDDRSNWDYCECDSMKEVEDILDNGFGLIMEKKNG